MTIDPLKFKALADQQLGLPYQLGTKWDINDPKPTGPCDCSGAIRWLVHRATGLIVPDGSEIQREASVPVSAPIPFLAYGYFINHHISDHIFVLYNESQVWNQEGNPYDKCLLRPRARFENWPGFSGWMTFKALLNAQEQAG